MRWSDGLRSIARHYWLNAENRKRKKNPLILSLPQRLSPFRKSTLSVVIAPFSILTLAVLTLCGGRPCITTRWLAYHPVDTFGGLNLDSNPWMNLES